MVQKENWIQSAIKHPGAFTRWSKKQGYKGTTEESIEAGKKSSNPKTRRRAILAETLRGLKKK